MSAPAIALSKLHIWPTNYVARKHVQHLIEWPDAIYFLVAEQSAVRNIKADNKRIMDIFHLDQIIVSGW